MSVGGCGSVPRSEPATQGTPGRDLQPPFPHPFETAAVLGFPQGSVMGAGAAPPRRVTFLYPPSAPFFTPEVLSDPSQSGTAQRGRGQRGEAGSRTPGSAPAHAPRPRGRWARGRGGTTAEQPSPLLRAPSWLAAGSGAAAGEPNPDPLPYRSAGVGSITAAEKPRGQRAWACEDKDDLGLAPFFCLPFL